MKPHCQWYLELINAQNRRSFLAKQYKLPMTELHTPPKQIHNNKYPNRNNNNRPVACKCRVIRIRNSETQQPPTLFSIYLHFEPRAHLSSVQVLLRPTFHNTVCLSVCQSVNSRALLIARTGGWWRGAKLSEMNSNLISHIFILNDIYAETKHT